MVEILILFFLFCYFLLSLVSFWSYSFWIIFSQPWYFYFVLIFEFLSQFWDLMNLDHNFEAGFSFMFLFLKFATSSIFYRLFTQFLVKFMMLRYFITVTGFVFHTSRCYIILRACFCTITQIWPIRDSMFEPEIYRVFAILTHARQSSATPGNG